MSESQPMEIDNAGGHASNGGGESTTYENVRFKSKVDGRLTLSQHSLTFQASGEGSHLLNLSFSWSDIVKHQVSPANYPKALLKLIVQKHGNAASTSNRTFQLINRDELERIRNDISNRLKNCGKSSVPGTGNDHAVANHKKRRLSNEGGSNKRQRMEAFASSSTVSFGDLDPTALAVTRSSLLAANPTLRQQHQYLVLETKTVSEEDFWTTHAALVEEEYARISGYAKAGTSSLLQSHLPISTDRARGGRITLGVEEMRQIFILYPAVHKAYEEKVPLELSDEEFWRRYLASEYFHRDRGRVGTTARNHSSGQTQNVSKQEGQKKKSAGLTLEEQEARAAAVATNDIFARYDLKLREQQQQRERQQQQLLQQQRDGSASPTQTLVRASSISSIKSPSKVGRKLAVGQFDLASTFATERGELLQGPKDNHPPNQEDDGAKGARVIQKYNRHWAMVLHPDEAVAGADLTGEVAKKSVTDVLADDPDPLAGGGVDEEMRQLIEFAEATEEEADHAAGIGHHDEYDPLTLKNIEAYYSTKGQETEAAPSSTNGETEAEIRKRHALFAKATSAKLEQMVKSILDKNENELPKSCFPPAKLGKELLMALTKKMAQDSQTEAQSLEMVNQLPDDFRMNLQSYFRRSSELLRHFFGLRRLEAQGSAGHSPKLARIVVGMETFYREMEVTRKQLPQSEEGEKMRKMFLPLMDQLDWAFKLHREGSGGGGGGGFVSV